MTNVFDIIKTFSQDDLKEFMEHHGTEFKTKSMGFCPFHTHNNDSPSISIKTQDGTAFFNCFTCKAAGDIGKYASLFFRCSPLEGAKKVLDYFGIVHDIDAKDLSDEEKEELKRKEEERLETSRLKREKSLKKEERLKIWWQTQATQSAPILAENFYNFRDKIDEDVKSLFPNQSPIFEDFANSYLGYDTEHKSIAILIREDKKVFNIKHRLKFIYNKANKTLTDERMPGKWIGYPNLSGSPFPMEYFKQHIDSRVIICEGEKDALNLLSYNVNVLTLGGATNSWVRYKHLLKDKTIFIWFDNDKAGYENALLRYLELKDHVKDIFIVPFFAIAGTLPNKYDISDFLEEKDFDSADDIFSAIAYSSFKLTATLIEEIEEFTDLKLQHLLPLQKPKDFRDIKRIWMTKDKEGHYVNVFICKGELDDEYINFVINKILGLKHSSKNQVNEVCESIAKTLLINQDEKLKESKDIVAAMFEFFKVKQTLLSNYRQTHLVDITQAFLQMCKKAGYPLGEYQQGLHVWTGTHYLRIDDNALSKFIISFWMPAAKVDFKKQTEENVIKVVKNLLMRSLNLDEIKQYEQRRIMTCLNGTLFISPKGKIHFQDRHNSNLAVTNLLNFEYNPKAKCPKWKKFLNRVVPDPDNQKTIMEFLGYCFLPSHNYEAFLYLYGSSGANGKSVILDVFQSFLGDENVSALQLGQLHGHELHGLANKLLNVGSELQKEGLDKGQFAVLKNLVSPKDKIQINPKQRDPYVLLPKDKPKLAIAGNEKAWQGVDNAVLRRMLFISFDIEIKDNEKVRGLSDRFNDELSGIFNLALEGLRRLIRQGGFTKSDKMKMELNEYRDDINPVRTFIRDALIIDKQIRVPKKYLYTLYQSYINEKGGRPLKDSNFFKSIKKEFLTQNIKIEETHARFPKDNILVGLSERVKCVEGIKINPNFEINSINIGGVSLDTKQMNLFKNSSLLIEDL